MKNFFKGIIVGLGGIAPGLSGSVLLIIFGLYQKTLDALGTLFLDFKKNIKFLLPLLAGMGIGVLIFSNILDFFLNNYEVYTRYMFLGLILGTIPLFYKEVRKNGFSNKYYVLIIFAFIVGTAVFTLNSSAFTQIDNPNLFQSIVLGICVAASAIVPGIDPAVLLSTLGLYEAYVTALANLDISILLPMVSGLAIGGIGISFGMSILFKKFYTITFSIIFGVFLSMIPNMLNEKCALGLNFSSVICIIFVIIGFSISFYLNDIKGNNLKIKKFLGRL